MTSLHEGYFGWLRYQQNSMLWPMLCTCPVHPDGFFHQRDRIWQRKKALELDHSGSSRKVPGGKEP